MNIFALQPGHPDVLKPNSSRLVSDAQLRLPQVKGLTIRFRRDWPLSFVESQVERCRKIGKPYTLLLMSGDIAEPWRAPTVASYRMHSIRLSKLFADDPLCWGVHVTGCTPGPPSGKTNGTSEELHWKPMTDVVQKANRQLFLAWSAGFPLQNLLWAISIKCPVECRELIDFAIANRSAKRVLIKHNAASAKMNVEAAHNDLLVYADSKGARIGFEMLCETQSAKGRKRFGGTLRQGLAKIGAVAKRAGSEVDYLAVYPPDLEGVSDGRDRPREAAH